MELTGAKRCVTTAIGCAIVLILAASAASAEDPPPFLLEWGSFGTADGQFNAPFGIDTDSLGNVYVSDVVNNRIQKFDANGTHLLSWGSAGAGDGEFGAGTMRHLAVGPGDEIFVVDAANTNARVQVFNSNGVYQRQFAIDVSACGPFECGRFAIGIAVESSTGDVYVTVGGGNVCPCDGQRYWVRKYTNAGVFILEWGNNGPSSAPGGLTRPSGIALDQSGNVYVLESFAARMQVFDSDGNFLSVINSTPSGDGFFFNVNAITVDSSGNVYLGDRAGQRIQKFDPAGNFVTKWGGPGTGDGQFNGPEDITVTPGGIFYVSDAQNHRIQKFGAAVLEVAIDIKPTSCPNPLNVKSKGVLPVAILGTATFDATQVDVTTVTLEDVGPLRSNLEDVATPFDPFTGKENALDCNEEDGDGLTDLTLKFDRQAVVGALGPVNDGDVLFLQLEGALLDGTPIEGEDVIVIKKKGK